jgi:hypothetical protein
MDFFMVYVYKMLTAQQEPNSKEMQAMTQERVRVCAAFAKKASPHLMRLHESTSVTQSNSVPLHSRCCSTGRVLNSANGVQLDMDGFSVCVHSEVLEKWFHYFRLRHFPKYMCGLIFEWVKEQPWYLESQEFNIYRLATSHWAATYKKIYKESVQSLMS